MKFLPLEHSHREWNSLVATRNPKEEWLRFEPFLPELERFAVQLDSRGFYCDEIAQWRNCRMSDCEGADFSSRDLSGIIFSGSKLRRVQFRSAGLRGANFERCVLEKVNFDDALLFGVSFKGSELKEVSFDRAVIFCCDFRGVQMSGCTLERADVCDYSKRSLKLPEGTKGSV